MKKLLLLSLTALLSLPTQAYEFKPFVGVYGGYNSLSGKDSSEANKDGLNLGGFGTASFLTENMVFDTSLGYQYNRMSGDKKAIGGNSKVTVTTQTLFLDLDARYRLDQKWSIGPTLSFHFNNKGIDNSFSEEEKKLGSKFITALAGAKVAYDTKYNDTDVRFFVSGLTNINDRDRSNMIVNVGIAFSFDGWGYKSSPKQVKPQVKKVYKTYATPKEEVADVKVTLKFARVGFATNAYQIDPEGKKRLEKLGKVLATYPQLFERVKISGHTDIRGGKEYNQKLSQDRADSVMKVFVGAGVSEKKIQSVGYGLTRPLDPANNERAWEKNRRTEIEFFGVKDRAFLNKKLEESLR